MRSLKAFQVTAETTRDEVLVDGQKVTFSGKVDVLAVPPSFSRTEIDSDRQKRTYFYDGKTFTIWAPRVSYYATVPMTGNLAQIAMKLEDDYDLDMPLADLFPGAPSGRRRRTSRRRSTSAPESSVT
jgi:hypothetical protein